jgi:hypothetical protein
MGRYSVDYTAPETIKLMAALPFYGQAEALIRAIDPLWKTELGEPREWEVMLEKWHGCNCCYCEPETKFLTIEALTGAEAQEIAETQNDGWEVSRVRLPPAPPFAEPRITVPDEFHDKASVIWEARHAQAGEAGTAETPKSGSARRASTRSRRDAPKGDRA